MAFSPVDAVLPRVRISAPNLQGNDIQSIANPFYSVSAQYSIALLNHHIFIFQC